MAICLQGQQKKNYNIIDQNTCLDITTSQFLCLIRFISLGFIRHLESEIQVILKKAREVELA